MQTITFWHPFSQIYHKWMWLEATSWTRRNVLYRDCYLSHNMSQLWGDKPSAPSSKTAALRQVGLHVVDYKNLATIINLPNCRYSSALIYMYLMPWYDIPWYNVKLVSWLVDQSQFCLMTCRLPRLVAEPSSRHITMLTATSGWTGGVWGWWYGETTYRASVPRAW